MIFGGYLACHTNLELCVIWWVLVRRQQLLFDCTQIEQRRLNWKAESKVGSLEKVKSLFLLKAENMIIM